MCDDDNFVAFRFSRSLSLPLPYLSVSCVFKSQWIFPVPHFSINLYLRACIAFNRNKDRDERGQTREEKKNPRSTVIYIGEKKWMASAAPSRRSQYVGNNALLFIAIMHFIIGKVSLLPYFPSCCNTQYLFTYDAECYRRFIRKWNIRR